jgi:hypothetical protein
VLRRPKCSKKEVVAPEEEEEEEVNTFLVVMYIFLVKSGLNPM